MDEAPRDIVDVGHGERVELRGVGAEPLVVVLLALDDGVHVGLDRQSQVPATKKSKSRTQTSAR